MRRVILLTGLLTLAASAVLRTGNRIPQSLTTRRNISQPRLIEAYGRLPLAFEANQGQTDARVKFLSRGSGYTLFLTSTEAVLRLQKPEVRSQKSEAKGESASGNDAVLRMKLAGA